MRIALLQPSYWPEIRRGSERVVHDLGVQLAARGHEVSVITSHPGPTSVRLEEGVEVIRNRRAPRISPMRWYEDHLESCPAMAWRLRRGAYDVAHAFVPSYAWAAVQMRRLGGPPVIFSFHGIPERRYLVDRRYRIEMLRNAVQGATACTVLSEAAAEAFRRYLLCEPVVLPAGFFAKDFEHESEVDRAPIPTLFCAAGIDDPRKRGPLMLAAFSSLRERRPELELALLKPSGTHTPELPSLPDGARWCEGDVFADIVRAYSSAWVSVLASVGEALGLVTIESLAAGTPVVAARSGAGPMVVNDPAIGRLFEPDDEADLVRALDEALELASAPGTRDACRARAAEFEWGGLIGGYEELYDSAVGGDR
jgi:glycosyltransferase involved in cell wall biosynthesis